MKISEDRDIEDRETADVSVSVLRAEDAVAASAAVVQASKSMFEK